MKPSYVLPVLTFLAFLWISLAIGRSNLAVAGLVFVGVMGASLYVNSRLEGEGWSSLKRTLRFGGPVLAVVLMLMANSILRAPVYADPLAGPINALDYRVFEIEGRVEAWNVLPASTPLDYEGWEPIMIRVADKRGSAEIVCDGIPLRKTLEIGSRIRAQGEIDRKGEEVARLTAWSVEILD
jgi:hypothetical protein